MIWAYYHANIESVTDKPRQIHRFPQNTQIRNQKAESSWQLARTEKSRLLPLSAFRIPFLLSNLCNLCESVDLLAFLRRISTCD